MAGRGFTSDQVVTNGNPLLQAEVNHYAENSKKISLYGKISEYMFWGATTIMASFVAVAAGLGGATLASIGTPVLVAGGIASAASFVGSVLFSRSAADAESHNAILHSDIDSQNQAHRMVQGFAKAQAQDAAPSGDVPFAPQGGWMDRVGSGASASQGSWVQRVEADRQAEQARAIQTLRG